MNASKVTAVIVTALLALSLCGCGRDESGGDPAKLAREITDAINNSASIRKEYLEAVDSTLWSTQRTVAILATHSKDELLGLDPGWLIELQQWRCADRTPLEKCGHGAGIAMRYGFLAARIDPASIRGSSP